MNISTRMYGLDALRGVAMTLGILLHGSIAYKKGYHYGEWVFDQQFKSWFFDWLYLFINSFRMQLFFLLAGFFASILIKKYGLIKFTRNRLKRIGLVLLISYFTVLPLSLAPYLWANEFNGQYGWDQLLDFIIKFYTLQTHAGFMHLWFLQHLLVYYGFLISFIYLFDKINFKFNGLNSRFLDNLNLVFFLILSSLLLGFLSQLFNSVLPSIWTGFIIPIPQLLYYLFFFAMGWFLENRRNLFVSFSAVYKPFLIIGSSLSLFVLFMINESSFQSNTNYFISGLKFLFSFQTMVLIIGFIGLFNSRFNSQNAFWSYIADSAYWVYLVHLPIVLIGQLLLNDSMVPGFLRFPVVVLSTIIVSFGTYHFFVRYTWIGGFLNGKRLNHR